MSFKIDCGFAEELSCPSVLICMLLFIKNDFLSLSHTSEAVLKNLI